MGWHLCISLHRHCTKHISSRRHARPPMSVLTFQLSPSAIQQTHDLLACLSKFSEYVTIEASGSHVLSLAAAFRFLADAFAS